LQPNSLIACDYLC